MANIPTQVIYTPRAAGLWISAWEGVGVSLRRARFKWRSNEGLARPCKEWGRVCGEGSGAEGSLTTRPQWTKVRKDAWNPCLEALRRTHPCPDLDFVLPLALQKQ